MTNKDAFDLWWEWARKPHESFLMIDADIPIMEFSPEHHGSFRRDVKNPPSVFADLRSIGLGCTK